MSLTYNGQINPGVAGLADSELHATPVDTSVILADVVNPEYCGLLFWHEVGSVGEDLLVRPAFRVVKVSLARVHAERERERERERS
jgi:hypothetical protein